MVMRQHTSGMPALRTVWSCELDWVPGPTHKFPEDDLIGDRNMSECFKCFKCF